MALIEPKLPTNNDINWGESLNSYLKWLGKRINNLEQKNTISDTTGTLGNTGGNYIGSGWQSISNFDSDANGISIKGTAFLGGANSTIRNYENTIKFNELEYPDTEKNDNKGYGYVYLLYDGDEWSTQISYTFPYSLKTILVGFLYTITDSSASTTYKFQPYMQTCAATLNEHKYNIDHFWGDFDNLKTTIQTEISGTETKAKVTVINKGTFYGSYLSLDTDEDNFFGRLKNIPWTSSSTVKYYKLSDDGKKYEIDEDHIVENESDYVGRVCLDIFGNVLVFRSNNSTIAFHEDDGAYRVSQELYSSAFLSLNDETLGFAPGCLLELCRFAIRQNTEAGKSASLDGTAENIKSDDITIVKSLNHGVLCQQSLNAWSTQKGIVNLNGLKFKSSEAGSTTQFEIQTNNFKNGDQIVLDRNSFANDDDIKVYKPALLALKRTKKEEVQGISNGKITVNYDIDEIISLEIAVSPLSTFEKLGSGWTYKTHLNDSSITNKKEIYFYKNGLLYSESTNYYIKIVYYTPPSSIELKLQDNLPFTFDNPQNVSFTLSGSDSENPPSFSVKSNDTALLQVGQYKTDNRLCSLKLNSENELLNISYKDSILKATYSTYDTKGTTILSNPYTDSDYWSQIELKPEQINFSVKGQDQIYITQTNTTFNTNIKLSSGKVIEYLSDRRLKENIIPLKLSYSDAILNTPIVHYNYLHDDKPQVGIVAQDLEAALPANQDVFVKIGKGDGLDDRRTIAETKLVYILWKGLQEEIEARKKLEREIEALKRK